MEDLISRTALLESFVWECCGECYGCEYEEKEKPYYCKLIKSAPAIEAVPVKGGWWEVCGNYDITRCSACKWNFEGRIDYKYCPNCGAKMED